MTREKRRWRQRQGASERAVYEAGVGRKTFLSLAFLILLPFFASLPAMLIPPPDARTVVRHHRPDHLQRPVHGPDGPARPCSSISRCARAWSSGETAVQASPCRRAGGATPMLRFVNTEIPYDQIDRVETRCVLFGRMPGARCCCAPPASSPRTAAHVRLGNVNEDNVDQALPFPEIGAKIAERAGVGIVDRRHGAPLHRAAVLGSVGRKTADRGQPAAHRGRDGRDQRPPQRAPCDTWSIVMAVLVVGGIAIDVFTAPDAPRFRPRCGSVQAVQEVAVSWQNTLTRRRRRPM